MCNCVISFGFWRVKKMSRLASGAFAASTEGLVCFVCDSAVVGRYYMLATCRTQSTKIRLVEKLGQLVGDDYMVVVTEDDIICRGCATMINSLDRLEKELTSLRSMVLRYLEKKYYLNEGELVNERAHISPKDLVKTETGKNDIVDFATRKRRAMCGEVEAEDLKDTKDHLWIQCDRCKYTTSHNPNSAAPPQLPQAQAVAKPVVKPVAPSQPVLQRVVQAGIPSQQMVMQTAELQPSDRQNGNPEDTVIQLDSFGDDDADPLSNDIQHGERADTNTEHVVTVKKDEDMGMEDESAEMITADITSDFQDDTGVTGVETGHMLTMDGGKQVTLQSIEGEDGTTTLCMVDENGMIVQKVEQAEDGTLYVQMPDGSDPTKQMLSVGEDGSVQMVEVLWDDMGQPDDAESHGIVNF